MTEEMGVTLLGNGKMTQDSENTHIVNELGVPITVIGLSNVVVAASPDGILVSDKASSPRIKDVMKHDDQRPMFEERRWGRYFVLDHMESPEGEQVMTKRVSLNAGKNFSYHYHNGRSEVWTIVSGEGQMVLDHRYLDVKAGDVIQIPAGSKHTLLALTDMEVIEVMRGAKLDEEDIVRLGLEWEPILQFCTT